MAQVRSLWLGNALMAKWPPGCSMTLRSLYFIKMRLSRKRKLIFFLQESTGRTWIAVACVIIMVEMLSHKGTVLVQRKLLPGGAHAACEQKLYGKGGFQRRWFLRGHPERPPPLTLS